MNGTPPKDEIVVGVDDSAYGRAALRWAFTEAERSDRELRVVRAWSYDPLFDPKSAVADSSRQMLAIERDRLDAVLAEFAAEVVTVHLDLVEDAPAAALVRASKNAAMLILGSHGRGRMLDALVGSITAHCLRKASCPVVVIPARTVGERAGETA